MDGDPFFDVLTMALMAFAIALVMIGLMAGAIGLPLTFLLARYRLERFWTYPLAGFAIGAALIIFALIVTGDLRGGSAFEFFPYAWVGALPGFICGAIWWWSYRRHAQESGASNG